MRPAVEHVHHGHRHDPRARPAQVLVERQAALVGAGTRDGQRHPEKGVGAEAGLVGRAVELEQRAVHRGLLRRLEAFDLGGDRLRHVAHRLAHALAAVARVVVVAQLDRLARARRGARGHHGAAEGARVEPHLDLHRGVAAGVEDLARVDGADLGHAQAFRSMKKVPSARSGSARGPKDSSAAWASATSACARRRETSMPWTAG